MTKTSWLYVCSKHGPVVAWHEGTPTVGVCHCGKRCKAYPVDEKRAKRIMRGEERWSEEEAKGAKKA